MSVFNSSLLITQAGRTFPCSCFNQSTGLRIEDSVLMA
nr:MAG TPA: hypothetical protein [Caudoviricetes sp.]